MYITADDIKNEISFYYPIDNRNGNKKVGLIRAYFVYSFYNVEKDENIGEIHYHKENKTNGGKQIEFSAESNQFEKKSKVGINEMFSNC